jgi:hypothetical protein
VCLEDNTGVATIGFYLADAPVGPETACLAGLLFAGAEKYTLPGVPRLEFKRFG